MNTPINTVTAKTSACTSKRTVSDRLLGMGLWNLKLVIRNSGCIVSGFKIPHNFIYAIINNNTLCRAVLKSI